MSIYNILFIAIGLAMDCFAVSISSGFMVQRFEKGTFIKLASLMGIFQGGFAFIGYLLGSSFAELIGSIDHWIAFILLLIVGSKMIYENFQEPDQKCFNPRKFSVMITFAIATSIDALAVGISFACLDMPILTPVILIGLVSFIFSLMGAYLGFRFGRLKSVPVELIGGAILIIIGLKILVDHIYFSVA